MFRWLIGTSLQLRYLVVAAAAALVVFGADQLRRAPADVFPEFAPPIVEVQTEAIGLSAVEVESLITLNLEELLSGVPWLDSIRSRSVTGLSSIVMTFKDGTDLMRARQMIQERLTLAYTLPNVAQPPVILQPVSATSRFMMVGLSSRTIDPTELSLLARWTVKPRLSGVPGVANVAIWGQRLRQMQVQFDPDRLRDARIMQEDLIAGAGDALWVSPLTFLKASSPGTGGFFDNRNQRIGVEHKMPIRAPDDLAKVPMSPLHLVMTGRTMTLGEVAEVTNDHAPLIGDAITGAGELTPADGGLMLVIEKFPGANTIEVTRGVEAALAEMGRGLPGVTIDTKVFRLSGYVEDSLSNFGLAMLAGAILVVLAIGAAFHSVRAAVVGAVSIVLSLLAALTVLSLTGATINTLILAGLVVALGVVIDDAIVGVGRLLQSQRRRAPGASAAEDPAATLSARVLRSTLAGRSVALYATAILVLAVLPVFFLQGVSGAFFAPLARSYVLALLASLLVALTVTPALCLLLWRDGDEVVESPMARWAGRHYDRLLQRFLTAPRAAAAGVAVLVAGGLAAWAVQGESLLPPLRESQALVHWATPPGTSHQETQRIGVRLAAELRKLPGVRYVGGHIGRAITGDQVVGINDGQLWVSLDKSADERRTLAAIRDTVDGYPGLERDVRTYLRDKVGEVLTGAGYPIVVRVYGKQREVLRQNAEDVAQALAGIDGLVELRAEGQSEEPQIQVKVDLDAAARAGVKPGDVRRTAATVFSGLSVGYLFEEQRIYDVVVRGREESRSSMANISNLWVEKADRRHVRLGDVAEVKLVPAATLIRHERIAPYVDVVANVAGRDLGSVTRDVQARLQKMSFPLEYHAEVLGEYAERADAQWRVLSVALAAVVGILLVMQACFSSWRLAAVASIAIPASLAGGMIGALVGGGTLSLGSLVGLLAVLGIGCRHAMALVHHCQRLEFDDGMRFGPELVALAAREQLPLILTSAVAIVVALLPIVLAGAVAGLEIVRPTAVVIIGGVIASSLATLVAIPALYLSFAGRGRRQDELGLAPA